MISKILLFSHIVGAVITGGYILLSLYAMIKNRSKLMRTVALQLGLFTVFQLVSSSLLLLFGSTKPSLSAYYRIMGSYLAIIALIKLFLWVKLNRQTTVVFSIRPIMYMVGIGIMVSFVTSAGVYGA